MRAAILDFGTNTFNLLIAEKVGDGFRTLYSGKQGVKLGKGGINKGSIAVDAMERGFAGIAKHMEVIAGYEVDEIHAYATSAMRNAENGTEFANMIRERFGFDTNIIEGEEEAALIYEGISASVNFGDETAMILDIGGGSNELIICNKDGILWKHSFELGMARIIDLFSLSDPISMEEVEKLEAYYDDGLQLLMPMVEKYKPSVLIGASGSFDTLVALAQNKFMWTDGEETSHDLPEEQFEDLYQTLLKSTSEERLAMPGMEPVRVEMMVPASVFINFVYRRCGLASMKQSTFALKEGVMSRLVKQ